MLLHLDSRLHFLLLLSFASLPIILGQDESPSSDLACLLEFKKGITRDPSSLLDSWVQDSTESSGSPKPWYGVTFQNFTFRVVAIVLEEVGLVGELKLSTLAPLRMLTYFSLARNSFSGRVVPVFGSITSLQHLDLSGNRFYGPIPPRFMELGQIVHVNLSSNNFTGGFPPGIRNLQQLRVLDLHSNNLSGDVGDVLSELRNTEYVDLSRNLFSGGIHLESQNLTSLANTVHHLNLSCNVIAGKFFSNESIGLFRNLMALDISYNQLTGELPSFASLPSLKVLRLRNNQLSGSIPAELLSGSIPLDEVDLSSNGFSGSILSVNSTTLKVLNLSSNALSSTLPSMLGNCITVDMSKNMIYGDLSVIQNWSGTLESIDLSSNALSGSIPDAFSHFSSLTSFNISNNSLRGSIMVLRSLPNLTTVDLSTNDLDGTVPSSFFTSLPLKNLRLSGNHLTGTIPLQSSDQNESIGPTTDMHMESLDLSDNSFTGSMPSRFGDMIRLKFLDLRKNQLSGSIPSQMSKLRDLKYLDLSSNKFYGQIPDGLSSNLEVFNVSYNNLSGDIPTSLRKFPETSFHPGNFLLIGLPIVTPPIGRHTKKSNIKLAVFAGSIGAFVIIVFSLLAYYRLRMLQPNKRNGFVDHIRPPLFKLQKDADPAQMSFSFSNDQLLPSDARSSRPRCEEHANEITECDFHEATQAGSTSLISNVADISQPMAGKKSSPGSTSPSSHHFIESFLLEQPLQLNVYSPDRLVGELFFLDDSLVFTAEDLSCAPAEVLGRSCHGTSYKATLDSGQILTVKWLRVGLVKDKKEFSKEARKIGIIRHPNMVPIKGYYWGPREQERLILTDYIHGDSLALHLYESTPKRHHPLSFRQRLKIAVDVAQCLYYIHDKGLPHGNIKMTNILLSGPDLSAMLTDYGLHRLMTPEAIAEQILNLGALGYRAPELASTTKPVPSFKADVYAFGLILMELLTGRCAGDIISGQSDAVDLADWVQLCVNEGRSIDCFDRNLAASEEASRAMGELLSISLGCILAVNERPSIKTVLEELCSITV